MSTKLPRVTSERVDDIPLILHWLEEMKVAEVLDQVLPKPHGNRKGLSYGQLSVLLLTYIVSQSDHRLCAVEPWVSQRRRTLERSTSWSIGEKEASDDRLGVLVGLLGQQQESREQAEVELGQRLIRAYELPTQVGRCDTSSFSVYHQPQPADAESKFQLLKFGHSKDRRPDLLQYRQLLGSLDPAGVPLVSATLPGNGADDPIYVPTWHRLVKVIGHKRFVYIADSKAGARSTRAQIDRAGGIYCFPVPQTGYHPMLLRQWVLNPPAPFQELTLPGQDPSKPAIGVGFEMELGQYWSDPETGETHCWSERYLVVRSDALARRQRQGLHKRLKNAEKALSKLAAKSHRERCKLQAQADAILKRYRLTQMVSFEVHCQQHTRYPKPGRPSTQAPSEAIIEERFTLSFARQAQAIDEAETLAGWRLYTTNAEAESLSISQSVAYYREQWQLERGYHRFKRGRLPALPIYLQTEERIVGLMFLLTIALRLFTLMEFVVRRQLLLHNGTVAGLYAGNPRRATSRPTAEQLLLAFGQLTLYHYRDGTIELTPLNELQQRILDLMNVPENIYLLSAHIP